VPTLGLFGPSEDRNFRPWGPNAAFVRTAESKEQLFAGIGYRPQGSQSLLTSIAVETVEAAVLDLLRRAKRQAA
jgi:hypothetical protein